MNPRIKRNLIAWLVMLYGGFLLAVLLNDYGDAIWSKYRPERGISFVVYSLFVFTGFALFFNQLWALIVIVILLTLDAGSFVYGAYLGKELFLPILLVKLGLWLFSLFGFGALKQVRQRQKEKLADGAEGID